MKTRSLSILTTSLLLLSFSGISNSSASSVTELTRCNKVGLTAKTAKGVAVTCVKMPDGVLAWASQANNPNGGGSRNGSPSNQGQRSGSLNDIFSGGRCEGSTTKLTDGFADPAKFAYIYPLGGMIASHITPIDHIYIYYPKVSNGPYLLKSPAAGNVVLIEDFSKTNQYPYEDYRVVIEHSCNLYSVFIHVGKLVGNLASLKSKMGDRWQGRFKIASGEVFSDDTEHPGFDYSLFDQTKKLTGFANYSSYSQGDSWKLWTANPLDYLPAAVKSSFANKYIRTVEPIGGKIDWDKNGTPLGNWFIKGTNGYQGNSNPGASYNNHGKISHGYWDTHLAIAPDAVDPGTYIYSIGNWDGCPCQFVSKDPTINPAKISVNSGITVVELTNYQMIDSNGNAVDQSNPIKGYKLRPGNMVEGLLAFKVNKDNSLTVEKVIGASNKSVFKGFTSAAKTYVH